MCVHRHACVYLCVCIHVPLNVLHMHTYLYVCMHMCAHLYVYMRVSIPVCAHVCMPLFTCVHIALCLCTCVCKYLCVVFACVECGGTAGAIRYRCKVAATPECCLWQWEYTHSSRLFS